MLMIVADESKPLPPHNELAKLGAAYAQFTESIAKSGQLRAGVRLHPSSKATTLRGEKLSDSSFVAGKDQLAGFYLVECDHLDQAIAIARRIPGVNLGEAVEIRPIVLG